MTSPISAGRAMQAAGASCIIAGTYVWLGLGQAMVLTGAMLMLGSSGLSRA